MSSFFKTVPWLMAGAAIYHLSLTYLGQREVRIQALATAARKHAETAACRRLYRLATAGERGMLHNN